MDANKVLYISQEITPYLSSSPLAKLGQELPQYIQEKGFEVRTFMPKYGCINERRNQLHEVIRLSGLNIIIDDTDHPLIIKVATLQAARMQVYFIDNDDYFQRHADAGLEIDTRPADNDERIMFFVRGVVETVKKLRWVPTIVHCQGWVGALAPIYLKRFYHEDPALSDAKIVYSLLDSDFQGTLDSRMVEKLKMEGFTDEDLNSLLGGDVDFVKLNKLAIDFSDAVVQASANVNPELVEYAKASGKTFMDFPGDDNFIDAYAQFYNAL
jgi:starch synthase